MTDAGVGTSQSCGMVVNGAGGAGAGGGAAPVVQVDPAVAARAAVARLNIPMPVAQVGPNPTVNEWNMAAVGYPLWLWIDGPATHRVTVTEQGITITLVATRRTTGFNMGDGTTHWCGAMPPWTPAVAPGQPSPSCGHVYQQPSLPGGTYAVTATTRWDVQWAALGQSGTIPFERTGPATQLPVGEVVAVRTR